MHLRLGIKIAALASEAAIIRRQERRLQKAALKMTAHGYDNAECNDKREMLRFHRIREVRGETRSSLLAKGFLRGIAYKRMEDHYREGNEPDWERVENLIKRFGQGGQRALMQQFSQWKDQ